MINMEEGDLSERLAQNEEPGVEELPKFLKVEDIHVPSKALAISSGTDINIANKPFSRKEL